MDRRTLLTVSSVLGAAAVAAKAQTPASEAKYHAVFQHTEPEGAAWGR